MKGGTPSRSENAGVEGSSPSLSTNQITHFRLPLRSHDRQCERVFEILDPGWTEIQPRTASQTRPA